VKFYDDSACIVRPSFSNPVGLGSLDFQSTVSCNIVQGSQFKVLTRTALPFQGGFSLVVSGTRTHGGNIRQFNQFFTLLNVTNRYFVVSDSFSFANALPDVETVPRPKTPNRHNSRLIDNLFQSGCLYRLRWHFLYRLTFKK
jgi:hypothetical protein